MVDRKQVKSHSAENTVGKMDPEPLVGIFWLFKDELILMSLQSHLPNPTPTV